MGTYQKSWQPYLQILICLFSLYIHHGMSSDNRHLKLSHKKLTGEEETEVKVDCNANVSGKPRALKWISLHDQQKSSQYKSSDGKSVRLIISSLHRYDAGTYTCLLVTASGEEEKAEVHIFVRPKHQDSRTCRTTQFKCKVTKHCIFLRYRCDGMDDCGDGSDEECHGDPCANRFICDNSRCVDPHLRCDHVDHCGDGSDERDCYSYRHKGDKMSTTSDPNNTAGGDEDDDNNYGWVKSTIYTIIASTIGLVILISIGVILVFRAKMKRTRERRMVRYLNSIQNVDEPLMPPLPGNGTVEEETFLPRTTQQYHHGPSIIFNVNNGVQYMPRYRYFVENPPPYSEVQGVNSSGEEESGNRRHDRNGGGQVDNTPPPYSTLDRSSESPQEISLSGSDGNRSTNGNGNSQTPRTPVSPESLGENNFSSGSGLQSHNNNNNVTSSSSTQHSRACERARHSSLDYCTGCVHCVPSSSAPLATSSVLGTDLQRSDQAVYRLVELNHHQSLSQGQGPVVTSEREQRPDDEQGQLLTGNIQHAGASLTRGASRDFRGFGINSQFLHNLLTSTSSSSSHNDIQRRLTPSIDSESGSNESGGSGTSSGDDSVGNCTLPGVAGTGRNSIHETQTLKTRERDIPCMPLDINGETHLAGIHSLPVVDGNSLTDSSTHDDLERPGSNLGAFNDNNTISNIVINDICPSSLPDSTSGEAVCFSSEDVSENQLSMDSDNNSPPQSNPQNGICVPRLVNDIAQNGDNVYTASNSPSTCQTADNLLPGSSCCDSGQNSNEHTNLDAAAAEASLPSPTSDALRDNNNTSQTPLKEVAGLDGINRPKSKQGHLSVQKGQIVLHTSDGILAGQSLIPIIPTSSSLVPGHGKNSTAPGETTTPHLSGEIIVKDGNIMLQIPVGRTLMPAGHVGFPCMESIASQQPVPPSSLSSNSNPGLNSSGLRSNNNRSDASSPQSRSSLPETDVSLSPNHVGEPGDVDLCAPQPLKAKQELFSGGDLNIRDGQLILEPPKPKTPSSQILSHLQGAECLSSSLSGEQEDEDGMQIGPVVNDKRHRPTTGSASGHHRHHQSTSKSCNSDIVLPRGKN